MSVEPNTIIREHGNSLDVSIDGKFETVPKCTCGKCIVRRLRENLFTPFPYAKDLSSTYKEDFDWKDIDVKRQVWFESPWALKVKKTDKFIDAKANDMHEAVVKEISDNLAKGWLYEDD